MRIHLTCGFRSRARHAGRNAAGRNHDRPGRRRRFRERGQLRILAAKIRQQARGAAFQIHVEKCVHATGGNRQTAARIDPAGKRKHRSNNELALQQNLIAEAEVIRPGDEIQKASLGQPVVDREDLLPYRAGFRSVAVAVVAEQEKKDSSEKLVGKCGLRQFAK